MPVSTPWCQGKRNFWGVPKGPSRSATSVGRHASTSSTCLPRGTNRSTGVTRQTYYAHMSAMPSTKNRILASAMRLLDNGGPGAVTLHAVGDASGISQSAPYRHYEDKRALLEAMVRANLDYFNSALEKAKRD